MFNSDRIVTDINEFNRVVGGGIVRDSISILAVKARSWKINIITSGCL